MQADPSIGLIIFTFIPTPLKPFLLVGLFGYVIS